ncbi:UNVERIFIED_CONTAM: hypothetical protein Sradi_3394000 [Sesamum radiatum]|uniref:Pre-rRNA-processing protein Ipi1 N-terminal domain-containing protein n=1 Tax=Sesamum radiatum TaxID=300843 RepID=A0AAW2R4K6_SESRA
MVKPKSQSKKPQKRGVDFKKIRRKIGRKLPPPKNATNTEIKSKAIVLPEQSIASEKAGLAVSKKGLTLKELLQQSSHHNIKVRKDALLGIRDILLKHPAELKLHKLAIIEKLRERIGDDDKLVRETLYQLFKSVIFPGCAKDNQGPLVSLMMAYIFSAMTHLALDVRLMAFKFFDLVVQFYPPSFSLYAEKDIPTHDILHAFEPEVAREPIGLTDISKKLKDLLPVLVGCFQDFMPLVNSTPQPDLQSCDCMQFILQSINLIVAFLVSGICGSEPDPQVLPPCQKPDITTYDQFLSPMLLKKLWDVFPLNLVHLSGKDEDRIFMLNTIIAKIFLQLRNWDCSSFALLEKFLEFVESSLSTKIQSGKVFHEKHVLPLIPYIPKLTMQISVDWSSRILQAFTEVFKNCSPDSSMKLACLSAIEEMLAPCGETLMDNKCALLRLLITLDSRPTRLTEQSIVKISHVLPQYLTDVVSNVREGDHEEKRRRYYLLPSFYLFHGSKRLLNLVLNVMGSWVSKVSSSLGTHHHYPSVDRSTMIDDSDVSQRSIGAACMENSSLLEAMVTVAIFGKGRALEVHLSYIVRVYHCLIHAKFWTPVLLKFYASRTSRVNMENVCSTAYAIAGFQPVVCSLSAKSLRRQLDICWLVLHLHLFSSAGNWPSPCASGVGE